MNVKLILPVRDIPDETEITKKSGETVYIVRRSMKLHYSEDVPVSAVSGEVRKREIRVENGCSFLINKESGSISVVPDSLEVAWKMSLDELREWLNDLEMEADSK